MLLSLTEILYFVFCKLYYVLYADDMDVLKVVQQLRDLAADPQNRATIVRVSFMCIVSPTNTFFTPVLFE